MSYQIKIAEPCSEDWNQMTPTQKGAFCASCKKEVIDFTAMSNLELARKISETEKNKQGGGLCGRFRPSQLDTPLPSLERNRWRQSAMAAGFTAVMGISGSLQAQERGIPSLATEYEIEETVLGGIVMGDTLVTSTMQQDVILRGTVYDRDSIPLPGVNIKLFEDENFHITDYDGNFSIPLPMELYTDEIEVKFLYLGMKAEVIKVRVNQLTKISVYMEEDEFLMGEVVMVRRPNIFQRIGNLFRRKF